MAHWIQPTVYDIQSIECLEIQIFEDSRTHPAFETITLQFVGTEHGSERKASLSLFGPPGLHAAMTAFCRAWVAEHGGERADD